MNLHAARNRRSISPNRPWVYQDKWVLLRIPFNVNLSYDDNNKHEATPTPHSTITGSASKLLNLPPELYHYILSLLNPVDCVCLALACKAFCRSIISLPQLTLSPIYEFLGCGLDRKYLLQFRRASVPDHIQLIERLAHGWTPKDKWRYCWECHKNLPRDAEYWRNKLQKKHKPRYDEKLGCDQAKWRRMSRKNRRKWLVQIWAEGKWEDSSLLSCRGCQPEYTRQTDWEKQNMLIDSWGNISFRYGVEDNTDAMRDYSARMMQWHADENAITVSRGRSPPYNRLVYSAPMDSRDDSQMWKRHPVKCPVCLEHELTDVPRPPRSLLRRMADKCLLAVARMLSALFRSLIQWIYEWSMILRYAWENMRDWCHDDKRLWRSRSESCIC